MINIIWMVLIILGIIYSILSGSLESINNTIVNSTKISLDMLLKIFPVIALWMGLMKIAQDSKLLNNISKKLTPILSFLFPAIPKNHESFSLIASNMVANFFGLGSAATPFGLKAMKSLQSINKNKNEASGSMITFLVLNTTGLTIIPTTIISLRMMYKSINPTHIVLACLISTLISTIGGLVIDKIFARRSKN